VSTADLAIVANSVVDLAAIGAVGWLIHARRIVFAATPKTPQGPVAAAALRAPRPEDAAGLAPSLRPGQPA